jgi:hypothetical protein
MNWILENAKDDLESKINNERAERSSEAKQMGDFFRYKHLRPFDFLAASDCAIIQQKYLLTNFFAICQL